MATTAQLSQRRRDAASQPSTYTLSPHSSGDNGDNGDRQGVPLPNIITASLQLAPSSPSNDTRTSRSPSLFSPQLSAPVTELYIVNKSYLVRSGRCAAFESRAIRSEAVAACMFPERAREIARRVWRQSFAGHVPEGETEEFDGLGAERMFGDGSVEVFWLRNGAFVAREGEDVQTEVLAGEMSVAVWRVGVDCEMSGEDGNGGEGGRTPESE